MPSPKNADTVALQSRSLRGQRHLGKNFDTHLEFLRRASYLGMYLRPRRVDAHILTLTLATLSTQAAL